MVPLRQLATERVHLTELLRGLDALGHRRQPEGVGEVDDAGQDGPVSVAPVGAPEVVDERPIDLERVDREALEVA